MFDAIDEISKECIKILNKQGAELSEQTPQSGGGQLNGGAALTTCSEEEHHSLQVPLLFITSLSVRLLVFARFRLTFFSFWSPGS